MAAPQGSPERRILCTSCDSPLTVSAQAKSISCPRCHQRVVTEAVTVKDYVAVRKYFVANAMRITKKAIVYASVRADDLRIDGVLRGEALVLGRAHLSKTARVSSDVRATYLVVDKGASLVGDVVVGPGAVDQLQNLLGGAELEQA